MTTSVALLEVNAANVQKAYIAYYGRPADPAGLNFWTTAGTSSTTMLTIMRDFGASAEFTALYGSGTNAAFVNAIYRNVFGRDADAAGLNFYVNALTSGSITRADVVFNVLNGATGTDADIVANKVEFSTQYTNALSENVSAYVNYDSAFGIPQARTALSGVTATTTAAQITASVSTSVTTVAAGATPPVTTGNTYTFTTNIETFSGTAFADTFDGRVAASNGTFQDGDVVFGGAGDDTLTLTAQGGSATASLNSVEAVNVRLIANTELDAINWSGTTSVQITNDSVDDKDLTIRNAAASTTYTVSDKADLAVTYLDASGSGDTAKVIFNNAGTGVAFSTLNVETINLGVSGVNTITVEGSADLRAITVSGVGTVSIDTNDGVSSISLAGFAGSGTVNVSATSNLSYTGGSGSDDLTILGLTSADTLNGGEGNDTLRASFDGAELTRVSSFETGVFTVSADVNTQVSGFSTVTFNGGTSTTDFNVSGINGTTLKFNVASADTVTLGYTAGAADIDLTSSGGVSYGTTMVTGASSVNLSVEGASTVAHTISSFRAELGSNGVAPSDVTIGVAQSASLSFTTDLRVRDSQTLTMNVAGASGTLAVADLVGSGLSTINLNVAGNASTSFIDIADSITVTGIASTLNVSGGRQANIDLAGFSGGNNASVTVNVNLGASATFGSSLDFDIVTVGAGSINVYASGGVNSEIMFSAINAGVSGAVAFTMNLGTNGSGTVGAVSALTINSFVITAGSEASAVAGNLLANGSGIASVTLNQAASGTIIVGNISAKTVGDIYMSGGAFASVSAGNVGASGASGIGSITLVAGREADVRIGDLNASAGTIAGISGSVGASASVTVGDIDMLSGTIGNITFDSVGVGSTVTVGSATVAGATAGTFGNLTISGGSEVDVAIGGISADRGIGAISITVGSSASVSAGVINAVSGSVGNITLSAGSGSVASADQIIANGSGSRIGNITLTGSGTIDINALYATASIGDILIGDDTTVNIASIEAVSVGDITIAGDAGVINISANSVGDINFTGSALTLTVSTGATASFGDIRIQGYGAVTVDLGNATSVGEVNTAGHTGSVTIDLDSATGSTTVRFGGASATNTVRVASGTNVVLTSGTGQGVDQIYFGSTAAQMVSISNFVFATGAANGIDKVQFASAGFNLGMAAASAGDVTYDGAGSSLNIVTVSAASAGITFGTAAAATDLIFIQGTGFSGISDVFTALRSAGSLFISAVGDSTVTAGGNLLILWYNTTERRTDLTLIETTGTVSASELFSSDVLDVDTLAFFTGQVTMVTASNFIVGGA